MEYKVFRIDLTGDFDGLGVYYIYVGAESEKDLADNYAKFLDPKEYDADFLGEVFMKSGEKYPCIKEMKGLTTETPYKILESIYYCD